MVSGTHEFTPLIHLFTPIFWNRRFCSILTTYHTISRHQCMPRRTRRRPHNPGSPLSRSLASQLVTYALLRPPRAAREAPCGTAAGKTAPTVGRNWALEYLFVPALNVLLTSAIIQFPSCDQRARHFPCTIIAGVHAFVRSLAVLLLFLPQVQPAAA